VGLQVLSSLGVIEEPVYQYQTSETVSRAAPQNKTACSSESSFVTSFSGGISLESVTSSGSAVGTIKISMHLVWFGSLWLALHMLAILCVPALRWCRRQQEVLWKSHILWVGPLNFRERERERERERLYSETVTRGFWRGFFSFALIRLFIECARGGCA